MAFQFVAAAHYDSASSASAVVTKPTGTADNDILFALVKRITATDPSTVPTGWAQIGKLSGGAAPNWLYWKLAASEGADYTWGWAAAERTGVTIAAYRDGFSTAAPIDVVSATAYVTSDTINRAASMLVTAVNSPLIFFCSVHDPSSRTHTPPTVPATFAEDVDTGNTDSRMSREIASVVWTGSGATGNMDATISVATADKRAFAVALNPAAAGNDMTAAGSLSISGVAALVAVGALLTAGSVSISGAADLDATGSLAAAGSISITGAADLDAVGQLAAAGSASITGAADLDATGTMLAAGSVAITGAADLDATGNLLAAGSLYITGVADLTSGSLNDIAAAGSLSITGLADLNATGALAAAGSLAISGAADLTSLTSSAGGVYRPIRPLPLVRRTALPELKFGLPPKPYCVTVDSIVVLADSTAWTADEDRVDLGGGGYRIRLGRINRRTLVQ